MATTCKASRTLQTDWAPLAVLAVLGCVACSTPPGARNTPSTSPGTVPGSTAPSNAPSGSGPYGGTATAPVMPPLIERPSAGGAALRQGVAAFDMGEYGRAQSKLSESFKLGLTNTPDLLRGYKTQAFVYCITARTAQCERSFDAAFSINKKFNLTPGERQHPVWGPVYAKVQKRYPI